MHFQMICFLGQLQNLNKVCFLKLFFFWNPTTIGHPVPWFTIVYRKSLAELAPFKHLIDLFIGAKSEFFSQTISFQVLITLYSVLIGIF